MQAINISLNSISVLFLSLQLFAFADTYRGAYDLSIPIAQNYYKSWSGYYVSLDVS